MMGVPVREQHEKNIRYIHNNFFEGKELQFQNKVISSCMKICPKHIWDWRVYGGDTPDANMVSWIYTQVTYIVKTSDAVRDYLEREGVTADKADSDTLHGYCPTKKFILKVKRIFNLKYTYQTETGEFTLYGFEN